jgi:pilus assembly protein Flp/PilA
MDSVIEVLDGFAANESGATAIEYGLLSSLIAVGCILAFGTLGNGLNSLFGTTQSGAGGAIAQAADSF